ncbi:DUF4346 domain-containing protein [Prochlorococcus sp. MIT 1307]|uniref:DUF4346 domain-containing protein n=1 Tax=Prochlorococcus sp. MIT 1307 TaxID=3096219 RepID=UPI002A7618F6|nr:DUF4346 domain-containing protein [Prochlorococcus sp. MIT 1307]
MASKQITLQEAVDRIQILDEKLSHRLISLDPSGYFIIKLDHASKEIVVEHYSNDIDDLGRAIDPETGKPLDCKGERKRMPSKTFRGKSAKEIGIHLTEGVGPYLVSKLDHALYLGRELQKAEGCLLNTKQYIQD